METKNEDMIEMDFKDILSSLVRKMWLIVVVGLVFSALLGFFNLYFTTPLYTSTSKIYVINRQDESKITYSDLQTGTQITQDYMILVTSRPVLEAVIKTSGVNITPEELSGKISIINPEGTRILEISVTDSDAARAKKLVDAVADISAEQLVNIMEIEKVNVVEYGIVPGSPTGQNITRSFMVGGLLGAVITAVIIIVIHMLNDNLKTADDIEHYLGITTLGMIPMEEALNIRDRRLRRIRRKMALASARVRLGGY